MLSQPQIDTRECKYDTHAQKESKNERVANIVVELATIKS